MKLVADSGSTKTDWCLVGNGGVAFRCKTQGINPFHQDEVQVMRVVHEELLPKLSERGSCIADKVASIRFYGAGCRGKGVDIVNAALRKAFVCASDISVCSDLMAAAHAVCRDEEGIACILGTGANSCLYDGGEIVSNVSPLGYILGDEGSGAVLGKLFLNELFKGDIPHVVREEFLNAMGLTLDEIIRRVYREPMANRFLASLSPFIHSHLDCLQIRSLVVRNFVDFFHRNVDHYCRKDLPVGAVGSIAYYYRDLLAEAASSCGYALGVVVRSPLDALCEA